MSNIKTKELEKVINILGKSSIVFMEYMKRFESSWTPEDLEEAKVMLGEMVLLSEGFKKALSGKLNEQELEAIYSLIPNTSIIYEELFINVSEWIKLDEKKKSK